MWETQASEPEEMWGWRTGERKESEGVRRGSDKLLGWSGGCRRRRKVEDVFGNMPVNEAATKVACLRSARG